MAAYSVRGISLAVDPPKTITIQRGDITDFRGKSSADTDLKSGGEVQNAEVRARAAEDSRDRLTLAIEGKLSQEQRKTGEAVTTWGAGNLPSEIILTTAPTYDADKKEEGEDLLKQTHKACFKQIGDSKFDKVAFPAISCGSKGFPLAVGTKVALSECIEGLRKVAFLTEVHIFCGTNEQLLNAYLQAATVFQLRGQLAVKALPPPEAKSNPSPRKRSPSKAARLPRRNSDPALIGSVKAPGRLASEVVPAATPSAASNLETTPPIVTTAVVQPAPGPPAADQGPPVAAPGPVVDVQGAPAATGLPSLGAGQAAPAARQLFWKVAFGVAVALVLGIFIVLSVGVAAYVRRQ